MSSAISSLVSHQILKGYNISRTIPRVIDVFNKCDNVIKVDIPITLQNGMQENIVGYRSQHNNILGPYKGGIRFTPNLHVDDTMTLAKWMTIETGKPLAEGLAEVSGSADIFEWNAEETKRIYGQTVQSRFQNTRVIINYEPVGVVAALSTYISFKSKLIELIINYITKIR